MRDVLASAIRSLFTTDADHEREIAHVPRATPVADVPHGDPGLFGPDSVTWRVHADLSMFVGGVRALFVQTLHPLAMAGVAQHSAYRDDPLGRLARTAYFVAATTYGSTDEARRAIAHVRGVHRHVRGVAGDGTPYRASDPELLEWIHHVEVDSFLRAYQRYGPGLDRADADRYVEEMAVVARALGARAVATSVGELRHRIATTAGLRATREAHDAVRFLLVPPLPLAARPAYAVIAAAAVGMVPWRQRLELRIPSLPFADPFVVRPAAWAMLRSLGWVLGPSPALQTARARVA